MERSKKRLLRITWNENNWELPSGHSWSEKNQGKTNIAYENQYGYGGEEWLFNPRYNVNGYQYGYIRGLLEISPGVIDEAYLFTINQKTKDRFLVGTIKKMEVLDPSNSNKKIIAILKKHESAMRNEILDVGGDTTNFYIADFYPLVRFKMEHVTLFDEIKLINELKKGRKYNRFKPYIVNTTLKDLLEKLVTDLDFFFIPGKRTITKTGYTKNTERRTIKIAELHKQIIDSLEKYLAPKFSITQKNISIEKTTFGNNIADVVLKEIDGSYTLLEVKTSTNLRANLREALGQLLDYALWCPKFKVRKLVIVSPAELSEEYLAFFKRMKVSIDFDIEYWQYMNGISKIEKIA